MSDFAGSESPALSRRAGVAALALGLPHEVRLKLAKRMRAEQLRRYEEREKKQLQESKSAGHSALVRQRTGNSSQNQRGADETRRRKNHRVVVFQAKDMLMDAAQNGDTDEGKIYSPIYFSTLIVYNHLLRINLNLCDLWLTILSAQFDMHFYKLCSNYAL